MRRGLGSTKAGREGQFREKQLGVDTCQIILADSDKLGDILSAFKEKGGCAETRLSLLIGYFLDFDGHVGPSYSWNYMPIGNEKGQGGEREREVCHGV